MPTNEEFEAMITKNINYTKPLEMKEKQVGDAKYLFPFWKPIANDGADVFHDYKEYLDNKQKAVRNSDLTGIVKPKTDRETYEDKSYLEKMRDMMTINTDIKDNTGIVKPVTDDTVPTKTIEQVTDLDNTAKNDLVVEKSAKSETGVGAVKPQSADMPKGTTKQVTSSEIGVTNPTVTSNAQKAKEDNVGIVKPVASDMPKGTSKQVTSSEIGVTEPTVTSNAQKAKENNVGIVKPQNSLNLDLPKGIDFSKYM